MLCTASLNSYRSDASPNSCFFEEKLEQSSRCDTLKIELPNRRRPTNLTYTAPKGDDTGTKALADEARKRVATAANFMVPDDRCLLLLV